MTKDTKLTPIRVVAKNLGMAPTTVFDTLEKIKHRFRTNKILKDYVEDGDFNLENLNLKESENR